MKILPSGDSAFILRFDNKISKETHDKIRIFSYLLKTKPIKGVIEIVPAYTDIIIHYNPLVIDYKKLVSQLKKLATNPHSIKIPDPSVIKIPVWYGGSYGKDIKHIAQANQLSIEEVIKIHTSQSYLVYMLGFTPGFCYLGGMDERIATPRKKIPAQTILPGSVGIAANQTGIYPIESPGGWQILGRTPLKIFSPEKKQPFKLKAGDILEFYSIDEKDYERMNEYD